MNVRRHARHPLARAPRLETLEDRTVPSFAEFIDPHPAPGNQFGAQVVPLSTGNVVITSPYDAAGGEDAGAVYLFSGTTGALISTLTGSHPNDGVGSGVTVLSNGNYVVTSLNAGAVTWGSGTAGVSGVVSATNSLVGSGAGFNGVVALPNGNYVVLSSFSGVGAVTFGDGSAGVTGTISAVNSLVGSTTGDSVGFVGSRSGVTVLSNGNYVVASPYWDNSAGAVTWGSGTAGVSGIVSAANSLVGTTAFDSVGRSPHESLTVWIAG